MTKVSGKEMLSYLFFTECDRDNEKLFKKIKNKERPATDTLTIKELCDKFHKQWIEDTICVLDDDYPEWLKPYAEHFIIFERKYLKEIKEVYDKANNQMRKEGE